MGKQEEAEAFYRRGKEAFDQLLLQPGYRDLLYSIELGSKVAATIDLPGVELERGARGVVTDIEYLDEDNPVPNHGFIAVTFVNGEVETFTHYGWRDCLELL